MKSFNYIIALVLFLSIGNISAQSITEAFNMQDYAAIKNLLSPTVTVKLNNKEKAVGTAKGLQLVKNTLSEFKPVRMESKHKGSSEGAKGDYLIAKLFNAQNEALRVFIHLENNGAAKHICDIKMRRS